MASTDEAPRAVWRWLGWAAVSVLLAAVAGIGLVSAGVFDPEPMGQLAYQTQLSPVAVDAGSRMILWLDNGPSEYQNSLRLLAAYKEGESDIGYGLVIGDEQHHVIVAVSPLGYLAFWERAAAEDQSLASNFHVPWQTWPHVRSGTQENEIWVDVIESQVTSIRINGELLWRGKVSLEGRKVGLWAESFGAPAEIDFLRFRLFSEG